MHYIFRLDSLLIVTIHINEPLLPKKINKKIRQEIYLLQQFGQLEILLEKKNRLEVWKSNGGLRTADATIKVCFFKKYLVYIYIIFTKKITGFGSQDINHSKKS